jgi:hypothetical protein
MFYADISRDTADELLFEHIIQMCIARILSRLRSKHAAKTQKTKNKPKMPLLLAGAVSPSRPESSAGASKNATRATKMHDQCNELNGTFEKLENSTDTDTMLQYLKELLSLAYHFDIRTLVTVLKQSNLADSTLEGYLPRAIEKLGHYRAIATGLANAARTTRHPLFKRITVRSITPPNILLDNGPLNDALRNFEAVWSRSASKISRNQSKLLYEKTRVKYHSRILSRRTTWKVHAEIQILCYYEQRPHQPLPRAICASKSACYLCNLFLETHGKFVVPRTHGKIYDRWTLPPQCSLNPETIQRLLPVMQRFNRAVEKTTLEALKGEIGHYAPPNESVVALHEPWSSHSTIVPQQPAVPRLLPLEDALSPTKLDDGHALCAKGSTSNSRTSPSSSVVSIRSARGTYSSFLKQGEQICKDLEQGDCIRVQTSAIDLQFSWSSDRSGDAARPVKGAECYRIRIENLKKNTEVTRDTRTVDVKRLRCDQNEMVCFNRASGSGRIICYNGECRLLLTCEKVAGTGA